MKYLPPIFLILLASCAHKQKCDSSTTSKSIYFNDGSSCRARIRQVVLASDLNLSAKIKNSDLVQYDLEWVSESANKNEISEGHYKLVKRKISGNEDQDGE